MPLGDTSGLRGSPAEDRMNPLMMTMLKLLPKVLPQLIPMADSLVRRKPPTEIADTRLLELEQAVELLANRSRHLERSLRHVKVLLIISLVLSFSAVITVLAR
jgi:hypothetical protein